MARHRSLADPITSYRIGDPAGDYPVFSGEGASLFPGRWNAAGQDMIYSSISYSTALLEKLVHTSVMPPNQHFIAITIPAGCSYEEFSEAKVPDWHQASGSASQAFGSQWFDEARSLILLVPSVVARLDRNVLINPRHPEFGRVTVGREMPIWWDVRLFGP